MTNLTILKRQRLSVVRRIRLFHKNPQLVSVLNSKKARLDHEIRLLRLKRSSKKK